MAEFNTVIKGGTIIDGLRTPRYVADIGITDGHIAYIGRLNASDGDQVLDAAGLIVAPGFVDLHTHYDGQVYWDPYCSISGWHGVTSVVIGNCGFGFAPVRPDDRERAMLSLARNEAIPLESMQEGMPWDWETYPEFLDSLERTPKGVNLLSYVGLGPLMMYVMGLEAAKNRLPNEAEMAEMSRILEEAIKAGGCGFSAQVLGPGSGQRDYDGTPMITDTMAPETLLSFAEVLAKCRAGFIQLTGGGMELNEQLAEVSGRPVIYNLILAMGQDQHGNKMEGHHKTIAWLNEANARGNRVFGQAVTVKIGYELTLEHWNMFDTYELWRELTLGTVEERMAKMGDPERRPALRAEYDEGKGPSAPGRDEEAEVDGHIGRGIAVLTVQEVEDPSLKHFEGLTVKEIAEQSGKHVVDAFLDLGVADKLRTTWVTPPEETDVQVDERGGELTLRDSRRLRRRGAHEVPGDGRLSDGDAGGAGSRPRDHGPGAGALAPERLPGPGRGVQGPGLDQGRFTGGHRDLRPGEPRHRPDGEGLRPSRRAVAARAPGRGLPLDPRERRGDRGGRGDDRGHTGPPHPPRRRVGGWYGA